MRAKRRVEQKGREDKCVQSIRHRFYVSKSDTHQNKIFWWRTLCLQDKVYIDCYSLCIPLDLPCSSPCWSWEGLLGGCIKGTRGGKLQPIWVKVPESVVKQGKQQNEVIVFLAEDVKSHHSYEEAFARTHGTLLWIPLTVVPKAFHKHERVPSVRVQIWMQIS